MYKPLHLLLLISLCFFTLGCSSVKVLDTWSSKDVKTVKSKSILVIARTSHEPSRTAFEDAMVKELDKKRLKATESYKEFPEINPDTKFTQEEITNIKTLFKNQGFNAIVVSVLKDVKEIYKTEIDGGYTAGESLASYYGVPPIGFYGYLNHPNAHSAYDGGVDVPLSITTQKGKIYILQTMVYNLDLDEEEQLVALVTSKIEQPEYIPNNAQQYAKAVMKTIQKN